MDEMPHREIERASLLHDGIHQELVAIGFSVDAILTAPGLSSELREHFRSLRSHLTGLSAQIRDDIFALSSPDNESLQSKALHWQEVAGARQLQRNSSPARELRYLTTTEREILSDIATGATTFEIARSRHNSEATIKTHLTAIYRKLQVRNRVEAIAKLNS